MTDGTVQGFRHQAKEALAGRPGLSKDEQLERLDAAAAAIASAREIVANREDVVAEETDEDEGDLDFEEEDTEEPVTV